MCKYLIKVEKIDGYDKEPPRSARALVYCVTLFRIFWYILKNKS